MSFRAHELIAALPQESDAYRSCVAAVKFDLGELFRVGEMADISRGEFLQIPAPVSLFQVTQEMDLHFFLARETEGGTLWRRYGKQVNDGFRWIEEDVEVCVYHNGDIAAVRISNAEPIDVEVELAALAPRSSVEWTIAQCLTVAAAIEVFSCVNVTTEEHQPPKFINEKRKRKGKVPFFSYRTIHITGEDVHGDAVAGPSHASPRLHLRRGHIRRLPDGKRVWVRAHLVGDKSRGLALHDYKVRIAA